MKRFRRKHDARYPIVTGHVPGIRPHYQFVFSKQNRVGAKRCSSDDASECIHDFSVFLIYVQYIMNGKNAAVIYDKVWWTGLVAENFEKVEDGKVKSMHPKVPSKF